MGPALAGHKGLRGQILVELKRSQPLTAAELGQRHHVSANAIRRHLKELEAEGLVEYAREPHGQGAPRFAYRLTREADEIFPKRYEEALAEFMTFIERSRGRDEVRRFFAERFRQQASVLQAQLGNAELPERIEAVVELLSSQGFMAEWTVEGDGVRIAEHNCAMQAVARQFPEICAAEADFLRSVLGASVERRTHIPSGCNACEYTVGPEQPALTPLAGPRVEPGSDQEPA